MNILQLLEELNIEHQTHGHKHCRPGWANMPCPFCTGNPGLHLGIKIDGSRAYCWRCGYKPVLKVLESKTGLGKAELSNIISKYKGSPTPKPQNQKIELKRKQFKHPAGLLKRLGTNHKTYLKNRNFNPIFIEKKWNILGTGPMSYLDKIDYRHRILIPIFWEEEEVSFQCRDITGKSDIKYKACPKDREEIHHKDIVYCHPDIDWSKPIIIVEGVTDVWRLGKQAVATFGIEFKEKQALQIIKKKKSTYDKNVCIVFDDDPQAVKQAKKLKASLTESALNCIIKEIVGDPADLTRLESHQLIKSIKEEFYE